MKALVISESQDVLDSYADFFKSMGYDNLCYRWLLKAMDNLEEIQPELIFINASDYPRHWKTLVQHVRAAGLGNPVVLLAAERLNDDEQDKARFLGIYCITSPIDDEKTRSLIRQQLGFDQAEEEKVEIEIVDIAEPPETDTVVQEETVPVELEEIAVEEPAAEVDFTEAVQPKDAETEFEPEITIEPAVEEAEPENKVPDTIEESIFVDDEPQQAEADMEGESVTSEDSQESAEIFTFVHPTSKIEITGTLLAYNPPLLSFRPYDEKLFKKLRFAQKAKGTIRHGGETLNVSVQVQGLDKGVAEVCILKNG